MSLPNIRHRLLSGFTIAGVLFAAFFFLPDAGAPFLLAALSAMIALEFYQLMTAGGVANFRYYGTVGCVALVFATWHVGRQGDAGSWDALVLFLITLGIFIRQFPQKNNPHPLRTIGGTLFGVLYVGLLWNFLTKLLLFQRPADWADGPYMAGRWLLLYAVFAAKFTDIGAYLVGCSFGKHKLIPRISPAKSWEGVFGGIVVSTAVGALYVHALRDTFQPLGLTWVRAIPLGVGLAVCAIVGDLVESLFKRAANVKDTGGVIPGMGGLLDVLDSILFTAPALYLVLRLLQA
ncbi:MAG TPA: phosphatidate cytidylyltransferase [Kiritimatiellia bacterium]|jgi:phosphatidate cytidylyltransferase|nr:phosphatidate cytidylyltransferase [Kiritimatiellia bacterium]HOE36905.1 phosphatidate cytidylyltransferase [Kiritimatiellia bacterium]HOR74432.1 phosphatidate cytidylyltransferase [Kiritimatiellia bacterium]HOU59010.1 phosphatidate cytidylyltransferase [Kiritimatiellia bacterium]HPK69423.1 phosphatidate cytidylyltransferase [Kiritimatiellia bacterium]